MPKEHAFLPPYRRLYHAGDTPDTTQPSVAEIRASGPVGAAELETACRLARDLGCDGLVCSMPWLMGYGLLSFDDEPALARTLAQLRAVCRRHGLAFLFDVAVTDGGAVASLEQSLAGWYLYPPPASASDVSSSRGMVSLCMTEGRAPPGFITAWANTLSRWAYSGLAGVRCKRLADLAPADWAALIEQVRAHHPGFVFLAWTPGLTPAPLRALEGVGFDACFLSLPWWDGRQAWLLEERDRLHRVAPVLAPVDTRLEPGRFAAQCAVADFCAEGVMLAGEMPGALSTLNTPGTGDNPDASNTSGKVYAPSMLRAQELTAPPGQPGATVAGQGVSRHGQPAVAAQAPVAGLRMLTGPLAAYTVLARTRPTAAVLVLNPGPHAATDIDWAMLQARLPDDLVLPDSARLPHLLPSGEHICAPLVSAASIHVPAAYTEQAKSGMASSSPSLSGPRIVIEGVTPAVDDGQFAVKRCLGAAVTVQADVLMDGHEQLAASLLWRAVDETQWTVVPMQELDNDRREAMFRPARLGRHLYCVQAWWDRWGSYRSQLQKKVAADQDVSLDIEEGRQLLTTAISRVKYTTPVVASTLTDMLRTSHAGGSGTIDLMLSDALAAAMRQADDKPFEARSAVYPLYADRRAAAFSSWYELFPRSQSPEPGRHGRFADVAARLPAIAGMGFDVVYLPPIHPIGLTHRKGRNNTLQAGPGDPGSPYAIGSAAGGHTALHPELGTLDDFRDLIRAAQAYGLDIAMDFAIQCSPDHPWLVQHPQWFSRRSDGLLRYAENPPKRYEDIVNPDFYGAAGFDRPQLALWQSLCNAVMFWADQGIRTFRVDNPHTKPLPFWQWLIAQVQARHPDIIFLSEAFTRPKMMYRLAKLGFTQSYTYFTWRTTSDDLSSYLTELCARPVADYFRPHFFVNTPDINPYFLQSSGRPGFLIRAALACTLSGLWGMYNGFELCEAASLPGKEEYLDSEKYQLRHWDMDRPGHIIEEITQLNRVRRNNPALQSHLGVAFHDAGNRQVMFYSKSTPEKDNIVLAVVSLDPHAVQSATLQLPRWQLGLPDEGRIYLHDLLNDQRFSLLGRHHTVQLTPDQPYLLWRLLPAA